MEIVNAILIFLALVLMWGALNLERSPVARVEVDQSSQLNDSMNFLQKLRTKSPKEEIQARRIRAFQANLAQITDENPELLGSTESILNEKEQINSAHLTSLINKIEALGLAKTQELESHERNVELHDNNITMIEKDLLQLVELIAQVQQQSAASAETIHDISNSIEKVKTVVGY